MKKHHVGLISVFAVTMTMSGMMSVLAQLNFDTWDVHLRAHRSFSFSLPEISSAVFIPGSEGDHEQSILAFPDSPPPSSCDGTISRNQAVLYHLSSGRERTVVLLPPFENNDIECAVLDNAKRSVFVFDSGSGRKRREVVTGYIIAVDDVVKGGRVPCRTFDLHIPPELLQHGRFADMEAAFLVDSFVFLVDKPLNADDPVVMRVALDELDSGHATATLAGVLPLRSVDEMPIIDWVTDAIAYQKPEGGNDLYLLGYNGVYAMSFPEGSSTNAIPWSGASRCRYVVSFPEGFKPVQTMLSEALVMTGSNEGFVIKESGRNARGHVITSPAFFFSGDTFVLILDGPHIRFAE